MLASDIHNNLLTLPTVRHYSEGHLTILDGDFTINGGKIEAGLLKGVATLGDPTVAVSGNHDSPGIMRTLERRGVTVLDHTDGVRTIAGLKLAGFEDPLEFVGKEFPSGLRTGLSFGDIANGHQRYLDAVQERWQWFKALPERPAGADRPPGGDRARAGQPDLARRSERRAAGDPRRPHARPAHGPLRPGHHRQQRHGRAPAACSGPGRSPSGWR